jgi:hypothetical protein
MLADSAGSAALALARVKGQGRRIIEDELNRLVRRSPQLSAADVAAIDQALEQLHSRLVLSRIQQLADRRPDLVAAAVTLFETGTEGRPEAGIRLPG